MVFHLDFQQYLLLFPAPVFLVELDWQQWSPECMGHSLAMWSKHAHVRKSLETSLIFQTSYSSILVKNNNSIYRNNVNFASFLFRKIDSLVEFFFPSPVLLRYN